jgi:hypothetical protein
MDIRRKIQRTAVAVQRVGTRATFQRIGIAITDECVVEIGPDQCVNIGVTVACRVAGILAGVGEIGRDARSEVNVIDSIGITAAAAVE